jgi:hypothetical protein
MRPLPEKIMSSALFTIVCLAIVVGGLLLSSAVINIERQVMRAIHEANRHTAPGRYYPYRHSNGSTVYLTKEQHRLIQESKVGRMARGVRID